jgi:hypothetical protein
MLKSFISIVLLVLKRQFAELLLKKKSFDLKQSVHYEFDLKPEPSGLTTLISALLFRCLYGYMRSSVRDFAVPRLGGTANPEQEG